MLLRSLPSPGMWSLIESRHCFSCPLSLLDPYCSTIRDFAESGEGCIKTETTAERGDRNSIEVPRLLLDTTQGRCAINSLEYGAQRGVCKLGLTTPIQRTRPDRHISTWTGFSQCSQCWSKASTSMGSCKLAHRVVYHVPSPSTSLARSIVITFLKKDDWQLRPVCSSCAMAHLVRLSFGDMAMSKEYFVEPHRSACVFVCPTM